MTTLAERVRYALEDRGITQTQLARMTGFSPASVNNWLSGETKSLKAETANKIAQALRVNAVWLITGVGEIHPHKHDAIDQDGTVVLKRFDVAASCGYGAFPSESESQVEELVVSEGWFRENISSAIRPGYQLITARGDSMEPTFADGDILVIDTLEKNMDRRDGCWCFFYEGQLYAKRIQIMPSGLMAISDNHLYQPFPIPSNSPNPPIVFGRIVKSLNKRDFK